MAVIAKHLYNIQEQQIPPPLIHSTHINKNFILAKPCRLLPPLVSFVFHQNNNIYTHMHFCSIKAKKYLPLKLQYNCLELTFTETTSYYTVYHVPSNPIIIHQSSINCTFLKCIIHSYNYIYMSDKLPIDSSPIVQVR